RACSALSCHRTPPDSSSIWASLIRRSALDAAEPADSTGAVRLLAMIVPATRNTKRATPPRIGPAMLFAFILCRFYRERAAECNFDTTLACQTPANCRKHREN